MRALFAPTCDWADEESHHPRNCRERGPWLLPNDVALDGDRHGPRSFFEGLRDRWQPLFAAAFPRFWAALSPAPPAGNGYVQRFSPSASPNSSREQNRRPSPSSAYRSGPSGAVRLGRAFLSRTEGKTLAKGQRPSGADEKRNKTHGFQSLQVPRQSQDPSRSHL
jgi:hypothetical protein